MQRDRDQCILTLGWALVGIGILVAFVSLNQAAYFLVPSISSALSGLFLVVVCQVAFAILDQADNSSASLQVLKMIAEKQGVDLSSLKYTTTSSGSPKPSTASNAETREDGAIVRQYKGREIVKIENRYFVDETKFSTLGKAQRAISEGKV